MPVAGWLAEAKWGCRRLLADHDGATHVHALERFHHRIRSGRPDALAIEVAHPPPRGKGGSLGGAHQLEAEIRLGGPGCGHSARSRCGEVRPHAVCEVFSGVTAGFSIARSAGKTPALTAAARTKSRKSGCGRLGRERNSG